MREYRGARGFGFCCSCSCSDRAQYRDATAEEGTWDSVTPYSQSMVAKRIALAIAGLWAGWWIFFEGAEAIGSRNFGQAILFLVLMGGGVVLAWRKPVIGGTVLLVEGLAALAMFTPMWMRRFDALEILLLFALMCAPPLISGAMLLVGGMRAAHR